MGFVIHWHESAMDIHVFPIPIPPPTSLSNPVPLGLPSAPGLSTCLMHPASLVLWKLSLVEAVRDRCRILACCQFATCPALVIKFWPYWAARCWAISSDRQQQCRANNFPWSSTVPTLWFYPSSLLPAVTISSTSKLFGDFFLLLSSPFNSSIPPTIV